MNKMLILGVFLIITISFALSGCDSSITGEAKGGVNGKPPGEVSEHIIELCEECICATEDKVNVCHRPGTEDEEVLCISQSATQGHLDHGDFCGPCLYCGDGTCDENEDCESCEEDCGECGEGICDYTEA